MRSSLAEGFRRRRTSLGLSLPDVAGRLGYRNITGGCNRILRFEGRGEVHAELLLRLADVLEIDRGQIDALIESDRREFHRLWNEWADQLIEPRLVVPVSRDLPRRFTRSEPLPPAISALPDAERYASAIAWSIGSPVTLRWSRRLTVCFDSAGRTTSHCIARPDERIPAPLCQYTRRGLQFSIDDLHLRLYDWPPAVSEPASISTIHK